MSEKKRKKKPRKDQETPVSPPSLRMMEPMFAGLGHRRPETPLDAAQSLMYKAWEENDRSRRVNLARKALLLSPDCADAYCLLAEHETRSLDSAIELYRKGVHAGERAIGMEKFSEYEGHFWGILETRPYMRARAGLAQCLWESGKQQESVEHYQNMLRLNPNDNQGIRDVLLACLLDLNRNAEASALIRKYEDDGSAQWAYSEALVGFRMNGNTAESGKLLTAAVKCNPHVPQYLLGGKQIPRNLPDLVGNGDESEAVAYAGSNVSAWESTPGALEWLRERA